MHGMQRYYMGLLWSSDVPIERRGRVALRSSAVAGGGSQRCIPTNLRGRCTEVGFQVFAAKKCRDALPGIPNPSILVGYNLSRTKLYTSVG